MVARVTGEGSAAGSRHNVAPSPEELTAMRALANVRPVANWLDAALNTAYKDLYFAKKRKDAQLLARATARLLKLRRNLAG